jgi:phosphoenolpyruvate synthase/pyruvate phosphate dikinase
MSAAEKARCVRTLAEIGLNDRPSVGGKGASLGELTATGLPVPRGFVVTTCGFERFMHAVDPNHTLRSAIEQLDGSDLHAVTSLTDDIGQRVRRATLPDDMRDAIVVAYRSLVGSGHFPVAVRSSATSEDSAIASFAGLQDTFLWVRDEAAMLQSICSCWASLYSSESVSYRRRLKLREHGIAMAVVIQRMVDARCSGVMFTRSPTTGDRSVITVEASWGLGSCIVSGEVTPDNFVVNKVTGEIIRSAISRKEVEHVPNHDAGGVRSVPVAPEQQLAPCLTDQAIVALAEMGKRIEQHYAVPQDIEWAIARDSGTLYVLQSRPETIWSSRAAPPVARPTAKPFEHVLAGLSGQHRR